ncbi:MAG: hypothetical protein KDB00_06815 [Planctomycetales bacterium]|nr:hypothetical protein [Planctomycetales bacterium]
MDRPNTDAKQTGVSDHAMAVVIQIDPAIEFSQRSGGGESAYIANDRRTGKFYRFGVREYHVVTLMDGRRTLDEICDQLQRDGLDWTKVDVIAFVRELTQHQLASAVTQQPTETQQGGIVARHAGPAHETRSAPKPANKKNQPSARGRVLPAVLRIMGGLLSQRFALADGDRVAARLLPTFGFVFSPIATAIWVVVVALGVGIVWSHSEAFSAEVRRVFDQQLWIVLAGLWFVLKIVHECGHAVCAKRHGVRVGKMGVMFFLFAPLAYVDVTDAWKLVRRRDRVQIALAGVYAELAIGAVAALLWWVCPVGFTKHLAAQVFLVAGPATLLVNANPLLRLDGYYVLSDLLEIPNLRAQGRSRLGAIIEYALFQIPLPASRLVGWRRTVAVAHAFCSVIFQVVWMSGLVIAISAWAKGLGIIIAIAATVMWGVFPLMRWIHRIWTLDPMNGWRFNHYQRRMIAFGSAVFLAVHYAAVSTSPLARRVPVVVRFQNEQIARAPVDAFVSSIFVRCGDRVDRGTLLMELEQPELILKRDQLMDRRDVELAKSIQFRQRGEVAMSKVAKENAESLERQLQEIGEQIDSLRVIANREGKITSPATDHLLGSFVAQGDELLRVSDPQEKEVLAIVAEDSMEAYKKASADGRNAQIRLRGGVVITAPLKDLQPSASRVLPHPALAVTAGGPLAVQVSQHSDSSELVYSQLQSVLPLDALTSLSVESGQIGRLTIPDDRTIVARLWEHFETK